ncbi:MAG: (2Fe-2S)-binding protein [Acidimicrobiales bacterium]
MPTEQTGPVREHCGAPTDLFEVQFTLNGEPCGVTVPARWTLADALREGAGATGTHLGCEHGVCGACTVLVDDEPVRSCLMLAVQATHRRIRTVEGLANDGSLNALQQAFSDNHALQCGFCTAGFLMLATALLEAEPALDEDEIRAGLASNLCRCTGYQPIIQAVMAVREAAKP